MTPEDSTAPPRRFSRRSLLGTAGAGALAAAGAAGYAVRGETAEPVSSAGSAEAVPFAGTYQAGIVTPAQDRLHFAAYDVTTDDRAELVALLQEWTEAARAMAAGRDR